ncbi:transposable element Tcb2 transposase [Trichonephila clavipes]|nr:transposable element Tcb2 transposase [Trichonephila clavipes]
MENGWSARRVARQLGRSDCVPTASSAGIQTQIGPSLGALVSSRTIRRCLAEGHLGSRCPLRVLPLMPPSMPPFGVVPRTRKLDCSGMEPDRSSDDNRVCVWKPRGEGLNPAFALQRQTAPTSGVMVWGAIAYNARSPLVLIRGTMTAQWYVHDILQPHVLPLMQRLPGAIFQQGNVQPHMARVSQGCLHTVTILPWPARSPVCLQSSISGIIWDGELGIPRV